MNVTKCCYLNSNTKENALLHFYGNAFSVYIVDRSTIDGEHIEFPYNIV